MKNFDLPAEELKKGPVQNRSCTDLICCCVFIIFLIGLAGTCSYGFVHGDPYLLLTSWDYDRNGCGYNETTKDYPYLYFPAPDISNFTSDPLSAFKYSTCVKSCPTANSSIPVLCKEPSFFSELDKFYAC